MYIHVIELYTGTWNGGPNIEESLQSMLCSTWMGHCKMKSLKYKIKRHNQMLYFYKSTFLLHNLDLSGLLIW